MEVDRRYAVIGLGLVDASMVALAEELGVYRVATRDVRHFSAVTLRGGRRFDLVVHPRRPDRGSVRLPSNGPTRSRRTAPPAP